MNARTFVFAGATVLTCHVIAYVIDVYRGDATIDAARWNRPLSHAVSRRSTAARFVRSKDFSGYHLRLAHGIALGDRHLRGAPRRDRPGQNRLGGGRARPAR